MMKKKHLFLGCALLMSAQFSYAGIVIEGGINSNTSSGPGGISVAIGGNATDGGNGGNGVGTVVGGNGSVQQDNGAADQLQKDIYASMCASPFMKKYASICQ
ncbi:hypothetical protein [Serratia proteamaculans]|uniref:hypothetical protein n=1 Tax=Serratia proteamaculans TaxID=28151 RepID=UPI00217921D4|nr:hypothetical protein [Serratia proteamaculans]CAI1131901.1 Uncharacterised protein [Serratia proteamaculans]